MLEFPLSVGKDRNKQTDFLEGLFPYNFDLYRHLSYYVLNNFVVLCD